MSWLDAESHVFPYTYKRILRRLKRPQELARLDTGTRRIVTSLTEAPPMSHTPREMCCTACEAPLSLRAPKRLTRALEEALLVSLWYET